MEDEMSRYSLLFVLILLSVLIPPPACQADSSILWQIGKFNDSSLVELEGGVIELPDLPEDRGIRLASGRRYQNTKQNQDKEQRISGHFILHLLATLASRRGGWRLA